MSYHGPAQHRTLPELYRYFLTILGPEHKYYVLALIYGVGISLLSLATPISVQMLINTVANTGLTTPLVVLTVTLFVLLLLAGLLNALRIHLMDMFGRRFYARMVAEISLRSVYALNPFFEDNSKGALFNRYFDIVIVQKRLPNLFVGGFTIVLQTIVGFILVSFYHPLLFVFNIILITLLWLVWALFGKRAIKSSLELSHSKHATAAWLEGLAASNGFFKTSRHIDSALRQTDQVTGEYMQKHRAHFRDYFAQILLFAFIYAAASASLLGLGGWLVIQGQLSLGQLVAAELVLSAVFVGILQMGTYLTYFYDLCAAIDELSLFFDIEQEPPASEKVVLPATCPLEFSQVRGESRGTDIEIDMTLPAGSRIYAVAESHAAQRVLTNFLKRHEKPDRGYISLGGIDFDLMQAHQLREEIIVLDRHNVLESSIREYLFLSANEGSHQAISEILETTGLAHIIGRLENGLDTRIAATGWPLSMTETMQLKLAAAIIAQPRVLVVSQIFDVMPEDAMMASLDLAQRSGGTTVVYFSNKHYDLHFDAFLYLGHEQQVFLEDYPSLCRAAGLPVLKLVEVEHPEEGDA